MCSAIAVEPTKLTAAIPGCSRIASTACLSPLTTLKTPGGSPASVKSSAMRRPAEGSRSDGFNTKVLPDASAIGNIHIGTIAGKLNGVIPAQTPSGWRTDQLSMPRPTCSVNSPFNKCGMPQANSTTSTPRSISPWASEKTLPCSSEMVRASASWSRARSSMNLNRIRARVERRGRRPARERRRRGAHRPIDLAGGGEGDTADLLPGRRVVHVAPAPAGSLDGLAADIVLDVAHQDRPARCCARCRHHRPGAPAAAGDSARQRHDVPPRRLDDSARRVGGHAGPIALAEVEAPITIRSMRCRRRTRSRRRAG